MIDGYARMLIKDVTVVLENVRNYCYLVQCNITSC